MGCFNDNTKDRAFYRETNSLTPSGNGLIIDCYNHAVSVNGYFFSVQNGKDCYVGLEFERFDKYGPSSDCNIPCVNGTGSNNICGGKMSNSVYQVEVINHNA